MRSRIAAVLEFDLAYATVLLGTRFTDGRPIPLVARQALLAGHQSANPLNASEELWLAALILWLGIGEIPPGGDPAGWADALSSWAPACGNEDRDWMTLA